MLAPRDKSNVVVFSASSTGVNDGQFLIRFRHCCTNLIRLFEGVVTVRNHISRVRHDAFVTVRVRLMLYHKLIVENM